jgi:hypothetical protein
MRKRFKAALLTAACLTAAGASGTELSCEHAMNEKATLKQSPGGGHRIGKHILQVTVKTGPLQFEDRPPHDALSGLHWRYCGYDVHAKVHLIEKQRDSLFSGELVFEDTGKVVSAGHTVLFAPDQHTYLAIEQIGGVDGESWSVRDTAGKLEWSGYAGTVKPMNGVDTVESSFERPVWNAQNELTARYVCADSKADGRVVLRRASRGWSWLGQAKCEGKRGD